MSKDVKILHCPTCQAKYPPTMIEHILRRGICLLCDAPTRYMLTCIDNRNLPTFQRFVPYFDFDHYAIDSYVENAHTPILDETLESLPLSEDQKSQLKFACILEILRGQIRVEYLEAIKKVGKSGKDSE